MRTVLVTGAAGFLGSHIVLRHLDAGDIVLGIDNFISSNEHSAHVAKINKKLFDDDSGMFVTADIAYDDLYKYALVFKNKGYNEKFDLIYNFACPASPPIYQRWPFKTMDACYLGTKNVLDLASFYGSRVIHASTSEVYGDPSHTPQEESYRGYVNSYGPRSCYDEGKRISETLCYEYVKRQNVNVTLLRIFNTYGPHIDPYDGRVVSNFLYQAGNDDNVTVYGNGNQTRSFCYVSDLIDMIFMLVERCTRVQGPVNVGNNVEFTVNELAEFVTRIFPTSRSNVVKAHSLPPDDPLQRKPDLDRLKSLVGNDLPRTHLHEGLYELAKYWYDLGIVKNEPVPICSRVIPGTFIACGEGESYCSEQCMIKARL